MAVIVCPDGGYQVLLIDWEENDIVKWLNQKGIIAFVLKYRTKYLVTDDFWEEMTKSINSKSLYTNLAPVIKLELNDAKAAITSIRQHAIEFKINPEKKVL